jgi:hypothetical protein
MHFFHSALLAFRLAHLLVVVVPPDELDEPDEGAVPAAMAAELSAIAAAVKLMAKANWTEFFIISNILVGWLWMPNGGSTAKRSRKVNAEGSEIIPGDPSCLVFWQTI